MLLQLQRMTRALEERLPRDWDPRARSWVTVVSDQQLVDQSALSSTVQDYPITFDGLFAWPLTYFGGIVNNRYIPGATQPAPQRFPEGYRGRVTAISVEANWLPDLGNHPPLVYDPGDFVRWEWVVNGTTYPGTRGHPIRTRSLLGIPSYTPFSTRTDPAGNVETYRRIPYPGAPPYLAMNYAGGNAAWIAAPPTVGTGITDFPGGASGVVSGNTDVGGAGVMYLFGQSELSGGGLTWNVGDLLILSGAARTAVVATKPTPVGEPSYNSLGYQQLYYYPDVDLPSIWLTAGDISHLRVLNWGRNTGKTALVSIAAAGLMWPSSDDSQHRF